MTVPANKRALADDEVAVVNLFSSSSNIGLGDPVTVTFPDGRTKQLKVGAQFDLSFFVPPVLISTAAAKAANPGATPSAIGVKVAPGQVQQVQSSLEEKVKSYSNVAVVAGNSIATFFRAFFDALISAVNALLLVAVVIAVFGIVNTLMLSIIERTHEIGLLRAVGMTRAQLWGSVQIEAMIVSLLGVIIGMAGGLFVAWTVTLSLFRNEETGSREAFSWPVREMVVIALLGVVIGVISSLLPALRAMRLNALEAIRSE
ncbi:MAG: FtsX-like permease family protein [Acidimicrobiales bacterium]